MFKPDPIGKNFTPYTRRPRTKHNGRLFVYGGGRGRSVMRVALQNTGQCTSLDGQRICCNWCTSGPPCYCDGRGVPGKYIDNCTC